MSKIEFTTKPISEQIINGKTIHVFQKNTSNKVIEDFGKEWKSFHDFNEAELTKIGDEYFELLEVNDCKNKIAIDFGGGTGRWTKYIAKHFKHVFLLEPSEAIFAATQVLNVEQNVTFIQSTIEENPIPRNSIDFAICLGVLHHIDDTEAAILKIKEILKSGGTFYFYFYHNLEKYGIVKKLIFQLVNIQRLLISKLPFELKKLVCNIIALLIYFPLARLCLITGLNLPLSYYKNKSLYIMRNDALDRFGTKLEKRYGEKNIINMLERLGFKNVSISDKPPYYHGYCFK